MKIRNLFCQPKGLLIVPMYFEKNECQIIAEDLNVVVKSDDTPQVYFIKTS